MNFLAHFLLAKPTSASRVGNLLGDFVTGTPESLKGEYSSEIIEGIMMHRSIDVFTDSHASFKAGKALLAPEKRRFAGIILDIFTDHFLAKNWSHYTAQPLEEFKEEVWQNLKDHWSEMPDDAQRVADLMYKEDWFTRYTEISGIEYVLERMSKRRPRFDPIADGIIEFKNSYSDYEELSDVLIKEALEKFNPDIS